MKGTNDIYQTAKFELHDTKKLFLMSLKNQKKYGKKENDIYI